MTVVSSSVSRPLFGAAVALCLSAVALSDASAQILRGIGKKATDAVERKATQKVDQKIDEAAQKLVDNSFDSVFGAEDKGKGSSSDGKSGSSSKAASAVVRFPAPNFRARNFVPKNIARPTSATTT